MRGDTRNRSASDPSCAVPIGVSTALERSPSHRIALSIAPHRALHIIATRGFPHSIASHRSPTPSRKTVRFARLLTAPSAFLPSPSSIVPPNPLLVTVRRDRLCVRIEQRREDLLLGSSEVFVQRRRTDVEGVGDLLCGRVAWPPEVAASIGRFEHVPLAVGEGFE